MKKKIDFQPHGELGIRGASEAAYITLAGSWNKEAAEVFGRVVTKAMVAQPAQQPRLIFIDGRSWELQSMDTIEPIRSTHQVLSGYFSQLALGYLVASSTHSIAHFVASKIFTSFDANMTWTMEQDFARLVEWARGQGFDIEKLDPRDFPQAKPLADYL